MNIMKILILCILFITPFAGVKAESKSKCHSHSFKLADLKGTYVLSAITGGGPGPDSSVAIGILEITDKKGNGNFPFLTIRTNFGTLPSGTTQVPSAQFPNPLAVKININSKGVGELLTFGFPTPEMLLKPA